MVLYVDLEFMLCRTYNLWLVVAFWGFSNWPWVRTNEVWTGSLMQWTNYGNLSNKFCFLLHLISWGANLPDQRYFWFEVWNLCLAMMWSGVIVAFILGIEKHCVRFYPHFWRCVGVGLCADSTICDESSVAWWYSRQICWANIVTLHTTCSATTWFLGSAPIHCRQFPSARQTPWLCHP